MALENYYDFAEDDYLYFMDSYERGIVRNAMGGLAQNICEKYLKHIIDKYDEAVSDDESAKKEKILRTHNLGRLFNYLEDEMGIKIASDKKNIIRLTDGYYFSTRYPGDDAIQLNRRDIDDCANAVIACRELADNIIEEMEKLL